MLNAMAVDLAPDGVLQMLNYTLLFSLLVWFTLLNYYSPDAIFPRTFAIYYSLLSQFFHDTLHF